MGYFVYHHWGCTSIHRPLSIPLDPLVKLHGEISMIWLKICEFRKWRKMYIAKPLELVILRIECYEFHLSNFRNRGFQRRIVWHFVNEFGRRIKFDNLQKKPKKTWIRWLLCDFFLRIFFIIFMSNKHLLYNWLYPFVQLWF